MSNEYINDIFKNYNKFHTLYLDSCDEYKLNWFYKYVKKNYLPFFDDKDKSTIKILEIGCNKGYLLKVLSDLGFNRTFGIDLSPDDLEIAKTISPDSQVECLNALFYLNDKLEFFDVVILKAVLEHIPKGDIIPILDKIKSSLKPEGIVIIDVPNMDWLFASHERYMDFTHQVGFTKESLSQLLRSLFLKSEIFPVDNWNPTSYTGVFKKKIARFILGKLLCWADPEGASNPIWCRSIVGVGYK